MSNTKKVTELLKSAIALLAGGEDEAAEAKPTFPTVKQIRKADAEQHAEWATTFGLKTKPKNVAAILATCAAAIAEEELEEDDLNLALTAAGLDPDENKASDLVEFLTGGAAEASADEDEDEEDEKPARKSKSSDDDEDEADADEDDEDEAPVKKGKKPAKDEDDEDESDDDEDEKPAKSSKKSKGDDDDEEEESEEAEAEESADDKDPAYDEDDSTDAEEHLDEYNEVATKKDRCKTGDDLAARLCDEDGKYVGWGKAYIKLGQAFCCGLPMDDEGADVCSCVVTGKKFKFDSEKRSFAEIKAKKK